jgi:hypothetical protein
MAKGDIAGCCHIRPVVARWRRPAPLGASSLNSGPVRFAPDGAPFLSTVDRRDGLAQQPAATQTTHFFSDHDMAGIQPGGIERTSNSSRRALVNPMVRLSNTFLRNASAVGHVRARRRGHRGFAIEHTLIALLVAFTAVQLVLVLGAKVGLH